MTAPLTREHIEGWREQVSEGNITLATDDMRQLCDLALKGLRAEVGAPEVWPRFYCELCDGPDATGNTQCAIQCDPCKATDKAIKVLELRSPMNNGE